MNNEAKCSKPQCDKFTAINELARRRGFFWPSFEIYGGSGGFVTYGPLGARLKQNIEAKLRELFVKKIGIYEMESSVIAPAKVLKHQVTWTISRSQWLSAKTVIVVSERTICLRKKALVRLKLKK